MYNERKFVYLKQIFEKNEIEKNFALKLLDYNKEQKITYDS
jgi:hypothetical protein